MKHNEATAAIRAINPAIFEGLHIKVGFDFEAPITIKRIPAPFTIKKAWKAVEPANPYTSTAAIIMRDSSVNPHHYMYDFRLVTITADSIDEYEKMSYYKYDRQHRYNMVFTDFCTKGDFNDLRKSNTCEAFIIVQHDNFIQKPVTYEPDWTQRQRHMKPGTHEQRRPGYSYYKPYTIVIDKSNYRVDLKRDDLKRRAKVLRTQRDKEAAERATKATAAARIESLVIAFHLAKMRITDALLAIDPDTITDTTADELKKVASAIGEYSYNHTLTDAARRIAAFTEHANNGDFTSPARYNEIYESIKAQLDAIIPRNHKTEDAVKEAV